MSRRLVILAGAGIVASLVVPATASPAPVDEGRAAATDLTVHLAGGTTETLELRAIEGSNNGPMLLVSLTRCDGDGPCDSQRFASPLAASALSISDSDAVATLRAAIDGSPLQVSWSPNPQPGIVVSSGYVESGDSGTRSAMYAGTDALVTVDFAGTKCSGDGGVGNGVISDTGDTTPVASLHLPEGAVVGCS
jgi:hypothetical protein